MRNRILYGSVLLIGFSGIQPALHRKRNQKLPNVLMLFLFWLMTWGTVI